MPTPQNTSAQNNMKVYLTVKKEEGAEKAEINAEFPIQ